jgi:acetylglutamate/LysW-gamma-L-alpha-aminoadipate kinase
MIVIKIGGSVVDGLHSSALTDIKTIAGKYKLVFVHGGGREETAEIYTMVMSGKLNKAIVQMLLRHNINAVGVAGIDGGLLKAERKKKLIIINEKGRKMIIEGGYTGKITSVDGSLVRDLLHSGYVPVISPIALSEELDFLNVDGDRAAAYVAGGIKSERVIFMTDVNGLTLNEKLVNSLTIDQAKAALSKIGSGMDKKVLASIEALEMGVKEAIIASGQVENPLSAAIEHRNCTVIVPN